jgi:hypothetical protein
MTYQPSSIVGARLRRLEEKWASLSFKLRDIQSPANHLGSFELIFF